MLESVALLGHTSFEGQVRVMEDGKEGGKEGGEEVRSLISRS